MGDAFLKKHVMKNSMHDINGDRATSLVQNFVYDHDKILNNPYFNKVQLEDIKTEYLDDDQI